MSPQTPVEASEPPRADHTTNTGQTAPSEALNGPYTLYGIQWGGPSDVDQAPFNLEEAQDGLEYYRRKGFPAHIVTRQAWYTGWQKLDEQRKTDTDKA